MCLLPRARAFRAAQAQWLLPSWVPTKWLRLFTQPWEGDITFVLPSVLWNMGKTLTNPSTEDLLLATRYGELAVWERLSAIRANCAIEATLDACLARITNSLRQRPLGSLGSRIPSWLHMSSIGAPAIASWGTGDEAGPGAEAAGYGQLPLGSVGGAPRAHHHHLAGTSGSAGHMAGVHRHYGGSGMREAVPDDRPPRRVASWGSMDIADSVADFPAAASAGRMGCSGDGEDAASVHSGSSGGDSGAHPSAEVMAQLDCCDSSAFVDLWASLLPLASHAVALEGKLGGEGEDSGGLDVIAP